MYMMHGKNRSGLRAEERISPAAMFDDGHRAMAAARGGPPRLDAPDIGYTFDLDAQGWTTVNNAGFAHSPSDGNPGGYISGTDAGSGIWAFSAPAALLGDREGYYGGTLSFDLWRSTGAGTVAGNDVVLEGGGIVLVIDLPVFDANSWTSFAFAIDIGTFHLNSPTGSIATEEQVRAVFADLDRVEIRGDYSSGADTTRLDNFLIVEGTPAPPPGPGAVVTSTFDVDRDGWAFQADVREFFWVETGGNPGGYLEAVDQTTGEIWYFLAPEKFVGDKSAFYGGSLAFELKINAAGAINEPDIILEGGGLTLVFDTPNNPGVEWTGYGVALDDAAGWRVGALGGALATEAEMRAVLGDLDRLLIRGEFRSGSDTGGIDSVVMTAGGETLAGGGGDNLLIGGTGYDLLNGARGDDTLQGNGAGDDLRGSAGVDWADYSSAPGAVAAYLKRPDNNSGDAEGDSYSSIENLLGSAFGDTLTGSGGANVLDGGASKDLLNGSRGDDTLIGGEGKDRLKGSDGADQFVLASTDKSSAETILDYSADDRIALEGAVYGLDPGALEPGRFVVGGAAGDANDRIVYDDASGQLFFDSDGDGAAGQVLIATLSGAPTLSAADFIVI